MFIGLKCIIFAANNFIQKENKMSFISSILDFIKQYKLKKEQKRLELIKEYHELVFKCDEAIKEYNSIVDNTR